MKLPPSRLVVALVLPGLLLAAVAADRAFVRARDAASAGAEAERTQRAEQAGLALRAEMAAIEADAAAGTPRPGVEAWRLAAPLPARLASRPSGLAGLSRAELVVKAASRDVTPSGLPVAVVAAVELGEERVRLDVAERLLAGRLTVNPDDLPALADALGAGEEPGLAELSVRLRSVPSLASVPRVPEFLRRAMPPLVEGWARDGADVVHWSWAPATKLGDGIRIASVGEPGAVHVGGVDGLALVASADHAAATRVQRQRAALGAGFIALGALVGAACVLLARDERAVARERTFLATVTHELRTPVTAMRLLGETLADGRGDPREYGSLIATECERVEALVERSLLAARTDERIRPAPMDVGMLLSQVVQLAEPQARRKGKRVTLDAPSGLTEACWDAEAVRHAISNLVDNALRHGGSSVNVGARAEDGVVRVAVTDDGPGIRRRDSRRVFQRFERSTSAPGGAGLGLWLAEQVARAHGGRIELRSEEGRGCTFTLVLPQRAPGGDPA